MKTVLFRTYYYEEKSAPGKEEGTIYLTDERHQLTKNIDEEHFDQFDEIPGLMRKLLGSRAKAKK